MAGRAPALAGAFLYLWGRRPVQHTIVFDWLLYAVSDDLWFVLTNLQRSV